MTVSTRVSSGGNVPAELNKFIGRRDALAKVKATLSAARCVSLVGAGGIGKTRLALRLAEQVRRGFPDGVWLVELAEIADEDLLVHMIAEALGLRDTSADPPLNALADFLRTRHLLLILDNCEHLVKGCAVVVHQLLSKCPQLRILATSRQPLGIPAERVVQVPPLTTPAPGGLSALEQADRYEAVRLFVDRAKAADASFELTDHNVSQVADLVTAVAGLPLAIELAAVRVRSLELQQIVDRLSDRLVLLTGGGPAAPARQRTLRAALQWSYDLCSPDEQIMWARVSVFTSGFDLEAAEAVAAGDGIDHRQVCDLVTGLVEQSILTRTGDRYTQLEPIHEYGAGLLSESGDEERLRHRHAAWYRRLATQAADEWFGADQLRWLAALHRERADIRTAITYCLSEPSRAGGAMEIVTALWCWWGPVFGSFSAARGYLTRALALDPQPRPERPPALWVAGYFALRQGDMDAAAKHLAAARAVAEELGDRKSLACAVHLTGLRACFLGDSAVALRLLEEAQARYRRLDEEAGGWTAGRWMALCHLAMAAYGAGDHTAADAYARECLDLATQHTSRCSRSSALWALGLGAWMRDEQALADQLLTESLKLMREFHDPWGVAECQEVLAWVAASDGQHDEHAAQLLGAAEAAWSAVETYIPGLHMLATPHDKCAAQLRERLGEHAFNAAVRAGALKAAAEGAAAPDDQKPGQSTSADAADLTPREQEVAKLIADGQTNREIADTLFVSIRTAETHVEHILAKLGATSRTQVAAWMSRGLAGLSAGPRTAHLARDTIRRGGHGGEPRAIYRRNTPNFCANTTGRQVYGMMIAMSGAGAARQPGSGAVRGKRQNGNSVPRAARARTARPGELIATGARLDGAEYNKAHLAAKAAGISLSMYIATLIRRDKVDRNGRPLWADNASEQLTTEGETAA